ncbi:MAG: HNH endonuclease [Nitrospinae bacterium]|nr:HNH endonuclease [Nitrospinota bacterium]
MSKYRKCALCDFKVTLHRHHIVPLSEGGANCEENAILLCPNHHALATADDKETIQKIRRIKTGKKIGTKKILAMQKVNQIMIEGTSKN